MSFSRSLVVAATVLLMGGVTLAAPTARQTESTKTSTASASSMKMGVHHQWGTVDSLTSSDLTLSHTYKGKTENVTFKIDPSTKQVGTIDKGAHVVVYYKNQDGQHVATEVKATKS